MTHRDSDDTPTSGFPADEEMQSDFGQWATQILERVETFWHLHHAGSPELTGAQCNFLIEVQRAAARYLAAGCVGLAPESRDDNWP